MASSKSSSLSGISVALGILGTGLVTGFLYKNLLPFNVYFSTVLILIGIVGFFIEVEKEFQLSGKNLGLDNSGVGLLFLAVSFWLLQLAADVQNKSGRYALGALLVVLLILGLSATSDGLYKILRYIFASGINVSAIFKTLGLLIPLVSSILALLKQANLI